MGPTPAAGGLHVNATGPEFARRFGIKPSPGNLIPVDHVDYDQTVELSREDPHRFTLGLARNPDAAGVALQNRVRLNLATFGECDSENLTMIGRTPYGWHGKIHLLAGGMSKAEMQPLH